jgi:hypothetical protein
VLFLEFGQSQPLLDRENHPRGEFGLWCDWIEWHIERRGHVITGSEDDRAAMETGIAELEGMVFGYGELLLPSGDSILTFSDDLVLRTFVTTSEEDARWNFRDRDGKYFHLGPDRSHREASLQGAEESQ